MSYSFEPHLDALMDGSSPTAHWYALVDAQDPCMLASLPAVADTFPQVLLFDKLFADDALALSPRLLALACDRSERRAQLTQLSAACQALPVLSVLCSTHDLMALNAHLQSLLCLQADGQDFVLRLADTQMLAATLKVMTPDQGARIMHCISQWWVVDHRAQVHNLASQVNSIEAAPLPLQLSTAQTLALLNALELATVANQLRETEPSFAALPHAQQMTFVDDWLSLSKVLEIPQKDIESYLLNAWVTQSPVLTPPARTPP